MHPDYELATLQTETSCAGLPEENVELMATAKERELKMGMGTKFSLEEAFVFRHGWKRQA